MKGNWQGKRKAGLIEVKQQGSKPGKGGNQGRVKMEDLAAALELNSMAED